MMRWSRASAELVRNAPILTDVAKFEFRPSQSICDNQLNHKHHQSKCPNIETVFSMGVISTVF